MSRVYFRGSREQARQIVLRLGGMLAGREPDSQGIARGVFLATGFAVLSEVKSDFIRKSRGGAGEDGATWPPLSRQYLAYQRRFGPGEKTRLKKAAELTGRNRYAPGGSKGLLTAAQLKRWRQIYSRVLRRLMVSMHVEKLSLDTDADIQGSQFMTGSGAKATAAKIAWATLKREGARTMLDVFGRRQVEILRDTGVLFNSLSRGEISGGDLPASYTKPSGDGGDQQIFATIANGVIVGTNVPYAASHNYGDAKRGIPKRQFLPEVLPDVWQERVSDAAAKALAAGMRIALETAA
ncbi:MAG: hypothetical protein L0228_10045 [Planctomycetes bacterium]|nr:hypothetical protein [Planctomycetota bacterium]